MPIHRLLQNSAFGPEDIERMVAAYENCVHHLKLANRSSPTAELLAKKIIEIAQTGVREPDQLQRLALKAVDGGTPSD
jgi:hypothetical protein